RVVGERGAATGGVDGDRRKQFAQLCRRGGIEAAVGAARQPGDLAERGLGPRIVPLLEHEHRHPEEADLASDGAQFIDVLLHAVADVNHGADTMLPGFVTDMAQHLADLGMATRQATWLISPASWSASLTQRLARHSPKPRK